MTKQYQAVGVFADRRETETALRELIKINEWEVYDGLETEAIEESENQALYIIGAFPHLSKAKTALIKMSSG